ncbi:MULTISPECIES: hypothetical protein [Bacillus]|uniref:hypothetical protein n=1 Tax=Bacillus TaxID=1386 RepID=UPI0005B6665F|nr:MULTISPECIES: hypothetical protein [Bacillus]AJO60851.1 hypothetical protein QF06_20550 [Bacillus sp. YP1]MDM5455691.1 hypothetical protein [Bacillus subtilis]MDW4547483.1 hypothetical protein [Bacillus subtilis subsp. subtilis]
MRSVIKIEIDRPLNSEEIKYVNKLSAEEKEEQIKRMNYAIKDMLELEGIHPQFLRITNKIVGESNED